MFKPGDVIKFYSEAAGYKKYHLCLSLDACCFFMNSPRTKTFPGDMIISCDDVPFLPKTDSGDSIISCSTLLKFTEAELVGYGAKKVGAVSTEILTRVLEFVENSPVLADEDKEVVIAGLGDWV